MHISRHDKPCHVALKILFVLMDSDRILSIDDSDELQDEWLYEGSNMILDGFLIILMILMNGDSIML